MGPTQKLLWKLYVGVIGAVTTIAAQRLVKAGWKLVTGNEPPSPTDPDTPVLDSDELGTGERRRRGRHAAAHPADRRPALGRRRSATKTPMPASQVQYLRAKHHPAPRSGARGGVLSGLTAPNQPGTPCAPRAAPPGSRNSRIA